MCRFWVAQVNASSLFCFIGRATSTTAIDHGVRGRAQIAISMCVLYNRFFM